MPVKTRKAGFGQFEGHRQSKTLAHLPHKVNGKCGLARCLSLSIRNFPRTRGDGSNVKPISVYVFPCMRGVTHNNPFIYSQHMPPWSNWSGCHFLKVGGTGSSPVGGTFMRGFCCVCFALLAQLVEQRTLNPWVAGSSPAGRT